MTVTKFFRHFFDNEKSAGLLLLLCTAVSIGLANVFGQSYVNIFSEQVLFWVNDILMTIFFLHVGLEIKKELYFGELSNIKKSLLPVICAIGGMVVPITIYIAINHDADSLNGFGIPMATDIAFSLSILSLLGHRVPVSLKIFLAALAVIDDMGAIVVIGVFYADGFSLLYFGAALLLFAIMVALNHARLHKLWTYILLGGAMWFFTYKSGVHPTISGVLLAFAIPFANGSRKYISHFLRRRLRRPVAFFILPLFALANTAILISPSVFNSLTSSNSLGIMLGLLVGKPVGIFLFALIGVAIGWCTIPADIKKQHLLWTGMLAGIGFTMSIFVTLLAFTDAAIIDHSKIAILLGSILSGIIGYFGLRLSLNR